MADSESMADQWLEAQRRYWDAWMDMSKRALEAGAGAPGGSDYPWADAMEQWWKTIAPGVPRPAGDALEQLVNMGKGYFSMVEGLCKAPATEFPEMVERWAAMMSEAFGKGAGGLNPFAMVAGKGGKQGLAFWDLPFDTWARTLSGGMPFPGDFMKAFETGKVTDLRSQLEGFLSAPAIGYARESQEQYQHLGRLLLDYEKAMGEYQAGFAGLGSRSLETFRKRMETVSQEGKVINTVREVFNIWVDACEEAYAEYAMSEDYSKRYGRMVNSLMAVKQQGARLVDEALEAMNVPTASELATLQRRLHDTRAAYQRLRCQFEAVQGEVEELKSVGGEIDRLRKEVAGLRAALEGRNPSTSAQVAPSEPAPAATAKPASRAKTSTGAAKPATPRRTGTARRKTP